MSSEKREKQSSPQRQDLFFETSIYTDYTRGTTQIAEIPLPLSDSVKPYALTEHSRGGSTAKKCFLPPGSEATSTGHLRGFAPSIRSLMKTVPFDSSSQPLRRLYHIIFRLSIELRYFNVFLYTFLKAYCVGSYR